MKCKTCNKEIVGRNKVYCSNECRKTIKTKKCLYCQKDTSNPKFCSKSCSVSYSNKMSPKVRAITRYKCEVCGNKIQKGRRYCSRNCRHLDRKLLKTPSYEYVKRSRKRTKDKAIAYLGGKCIVCGYNKCNQALDFHHLDPSKKSFTIAKNTNMGWYKLKVELDKCILLCSNCHRELHAGLIELDS